MLLRHRLIQDRRLSWTQSGLPSESHTETPVEGGRGRHRRRQAAGRSRGPGSARRITGRVRRHRACRIIVVARRSRIDVCHDRGVDAYREAIAHVPRPTTEQIRVRVLRRQRPLLVQEAATAGRGRTVLPIPTPCAARRPGQHRGWRHGVASDRPRARRTRLVHAVGDRTRTRRHPAATRAAQLPSAGLDDGGVP